MFIDRPPDHTAIIPKESNLGRRLATFTQFGLRALCDAFERRFHVEVGITDVSDEESTKHRGPALDFPRFEISFRVQRLQQIHDFEQLAFETGTQLRSMPE
jgi:hypothetical protein